MDSKDLCYPFLFYTFANTNRNSSLGMVWREKYISFTIALLLFEKGALSWREFFNFPFKIFFANLF